MTDQTETEIREFLDAWTKASDEDVIRTVNTGVWSYPLRASTLRGLLRDREQAARDLAKARADSDSWQTIAAGRRAHLARLEDDPTLCPTLCDPDCESTCHEGHAVPHKRSHDPHTCSSTLAAEVERLGRARIALASVRLLVTETTTTDADALRHAILEQLPSGEFPSTP